jgi:radical SAM protein with 4Fe4S-binding SPASM domain
MNNQNNKTSAIPVPKLPKRCEIELALSCNLKCVYCPRHHIEESIGVMGFELFRKIIDELTPYPDTILVLHRRGESLMHPRFNDCMDYLQGKFKTLQMATNATMLSPEKSQKIIDTLSFISFSLDDPIHFNETRLPAKYEKVEKKILKFLEMNQGKVQTQVSMVATDQTKQESKDLFVSLWKDKVDRIRIYEEHSKEGVFGALSRERPNRVPCVMPFYEVQIFYNGEVHRCNHDWDGPSLGDVNNNTIEEVWHNAFYKDLREQHQSLCITDSVCSKCDSWYPAEGQQMTGDVFE